MPISFIRRLYHVSINYAWPGILDEILFLLWKNGYHRADLWMAIPLPLSAGIGIGAGAMYAAPTESAMRTHSDRMSQYTGDERPGNGNGSVAERALIEKEGSCKH